MLQMQLHVLTNNVQCPTVDPHNKCIFIPEAVVCMNPDLPCTCIINTAFMSSKVQSLILLFSLSVRDVSSIWNKYIC